MLGQCTGLKSDGLLEKEREHGSQSMEVVGIDAHVDRHGLCAQLTKIKVIGGGRPVEYGVQPQDPNGW